MLHVLALCLVFHAPARAAVPANLEEARRSVLSLERWRFQPDPKDAGAAAGWQKPELDDSKWPLLTVDAPWKKQGYPELDGAGWYRYAVDVPSSWKGSRVILHADGVDDQYDLYLNGELIRHFGSREVSTYQTPTEAELGGKLRYGRRNVLAIKVLNDGGDGGIWRRIQLRRVPPFEPYKKYLPSPILDAHPDWVDLYWKTWGWAWAKVSFGDPRKKMAEAYMDEGYNEHVYQWDSVFMSLYGRYGARLFPAMTTLDNFYLKQDPDGFIERIYSETTGDKILNPTQGSPITNPPLFAWAEWDYYRLTGDGNRLRRVLPILERYDHWVDEHQASPYVHGMYYSDGFDSGMDNMPRVNMEVAGWIDISLEMALQAKYLALIADRLGEKERAAHWRQLHDERAAVINRFGWSKNDGIYYDVDRSTRPTGTKHIGAFWAMLADVADQQQAERLVAHLKDPKEFYLPHLFPSLSADDYSYLKSASYWQGAVWAPTDYMVVRGLMEAGFEDFAHEAALNHLGNLAKVYASQIDEAHIDPNERDGDYHTIWECYSPEETRPCTRADQFFYGRQDFAGWTGLGPVALLIEQAIGLDIDGADQRVVWRLREPGRVGLANFEVGPGNVVSLVAEPAGSRKRTITVSARRPFTLEVRWPGGTRTVRIRRGKASLEL